MEGMCIALWGLWASYTVLAGSGTAPEPPPNPVHRKDLAAVLSPLGCSLPAAEWTATHQPWTPDMVRQVAALFGVKDRAEKILPLWTEGSSLIWTCKKDPARQVALSVVRFATVAGARSYFGFAVDLQRQRDTLAGISCTSGVRILESHFTDVSWRRADQAVRSDKKIQFLSANKPMPISMVLAQFGDLVIECTWHGTEADLPWAEKVLDAFFVEVHR